MALIDSCGWISYFMNEPRAAAYARLIESNTRQQVSVVSIYEVTRRITILTDLETAIDYADLLLRQEVISLNSDIALTAVDLSIQHHLHLADSIILATAHSLTAELWTHDAHLRGLAGVHFVEV